MDKKIRIMLVDDNTVIRQGLSMVFGQLSDIEVVGEATDGVKAVCLTRQIFPDVILMDIRMPNMDGIEATRVIHSEFPYIRIIGFSMYDENDQALAMISAGAIAFRSKGDPIDLLLSAIRDKVD